MSHDEFIQMVAKEVIKHSDDCRIVPSIIIAHAGIISRWGTTDAAIKANNLFSILSDVNWPGEIYSLHESFHTTTGIKIQKETNYKKYKSWSASIEDFIYVVLSMDRFISIYNKDVDRCKSSDVELTLGQYYHYPEAYTGVLKKVISDYNLRSFDDKTTRHHNPYNIAQIGDVGDVVRWIQYELACRGYKCAVIGFEDGIFEYNLMCQVMKFQHDQKLPVTGIVDLTTLSLLASSY